jgi:uncharacterized protein (UPF0335 family)
MGMGVHLKMMTPVQNQQLQQLISQVERSQAAVPQF